MRDSTRPQRHRIRLRFALFLLLLALVLTTLSLPPVPAPPTASVSASDTLPWQDKSSPFGVVATVANRVRDDEIDTMVALMREAGVQWQREEIFWDRVQQWPGGPFTWSGNEGGFFNYDHAIGAQVAAGIQVLGLLDYGPAWFQGTGAPLDAWIDDWYQFVYAAVARYGRDRGWIKHWELWNEPNVREAGYEIGLHRAEDFVRLLKVGRAAARAADPEAVIVMGGISGILERTEPYNYDCFDYFDQVGRAGGWQYVDILAFHIYQPHPPEVPFRRYHRVANVRGELHHLDTLLRRYGPKPVWITEFGWSTNTVWPGVSLYDQAFFLVRAYLLTLAHPSVEKFFWYNFRNDIWPDTPYDQPAYDRSELNYHFGLLRRTYPLDPATPHLRKPSFLAFRAMTDILHGLELQTVINEGASGIYWYRFGDRRQRVDVLWHLHQTAPTITIVCGCREALVRTWSGYVRQIITTRDGTITLPLDTTGVPLYLVYDPPPARNGRFFEATGHTLRGAFFHFWHTNGGGDRFGSPITEELLEPDATTGRPHPVQYFERARFERFPELQGTPNAIHFEEVEQDWPEGR
jgi:hypothetical protein